MPSPSLRRPTQPLAALALVALLSSCAASGPEPFAGGPDGGTGADGGTGDGGAGPATLAEQLQVLSGKAVFFLHASVGANVMAGVEALLEANAGPEPTVVGTRQAAQVHAGTWAESYLIADNGLPFQKIVEFDGVIRGGVGAVSDVAFLKLCFADFWEQYAVNPATLFASYKSTMAALKAAYPGVTFVHFTVPLYEATDTNAAREQFSNLVRQEYAGKEPVFDIALIESTRPDGSRERDSGGVPALVPAYTDDGGHLNATGKDLVARRLVAFLASLP
jgi:hypothetical protein